MNNVNEDDPESIVFKVPKHLSHPDKLILTAKASIRPAHGSFTYPGLVGTSSDQLDIKVSTGNTDRALIFMDAFIKYIRERGHDIQIKYQHTYVLIGKEDFRISIREKTKKILLKTPYEHTEYQPTGKLLFRIEGYRGKDFIDGENKIEDQIGRIISKLESEGLKAKEWRDESDKQQRDREKKQRFLQQAQELKDKELKEFTALVKKANRWHQTTILRNYLNLFSPGSSEEIAWLEWAKHKCDWYDPFIEKHDDILNDIDRDGITLKH